MWKENPYLLHEDIATIPSGMVRERQDMIRHLRSIHTAGTPSDGMCLQELVYLSREGQGLYPKHHGMYSDKRMETLLTSGNSISELPEEKLRCIVRAGFFHSGEGSTLTCFQCGCSVVDWQADDDPWLRHMELQPNCPVLKVNVVRCQDGGKTSCSVTRRSRSFPGYALHMPADDGMF